MSIIFERNCIVTVGQWFEPETEGNRLRLEQLKKRVGLEEIANHIRYQLVHQTASSVIETEQFGDEIV